MKCPKCGSAKYVDIEYGLIVIDRDFYLRPDIQKRKDRREIVIGDYRKMKNSPKRMCVNCKFKYGSEPYYVSGENLDLREDTCYYDYRKTIKSFYFSCGGYFNGYKHVYIDNAQNGQA